VQNLRPLSLDDFSASVDFFLGNQGKEHGSDFSEVHYDSSSDEGD
jgi:hypothetical protein